MRGAGRRRASSTSSRYAELVVALSASGSLEIRRLGEMAEPVAVVWLRGPSFGCKAVWCTSATRSVRDFIHRHCQDQVRFVVPGRNGKAGQGQD